MMNRIMEFNVSASIIKRITLHFVYTYFVYMYDCMGIYKKVKPKFKVIYY